MSKGVGPLTTIYALSSGALPSGVAVVRISGPDVRSILLDLAGSVPPARRATRGKIRDRNQLPIDDGLVIFFPGPHSFTGQDCAELQVHGSKAVVAKILATLSEFERTRAAEPGEFTKLAMEAGKLDLLEVEGLSDLLTAETEMQRKLALEHSHGHLSSLYASWMVRLTHARAMIEAELDFADEDDVPGSVSDRIWTDMESLARDMDAHLSRARIGEIIRDGLKVVLIGEPNAGKSSLLNYLARRDVAIVTSVPGTTRDILSVQLDIQGFAVTLVDTAGLRITEDTIELEGIRRAHLAAEQADIVLLLHPCAETGPAPQAIPANRIIKVGTKLDIAGNPDRDRFDVMVSTVTGEGVDALMTLLMRDLSELESGKSLAIPARIRHVSLLQEARSHLLDALERHDLELALRAEYLRLCAHRLGRITGQVDTEGLLDVIFSTFCVGK